MARSRPSGIDSELTALLAAAARPTTLETIFRLRALAEIAEEATTTTLIRLASDLACNSSERGPADVRTLKLSKTAS